MDGGLPSRPEDLSALRLQQGMQELHRAAPQAAGGETDPETQQAVQRVLTVVRGTGNGAAPDLTLDDVVRFYNVGRALPTPSACSKSVSLWRCRESFWIGLVAADVGRRGEKMAGFLCREGSASMQGASIYVWGNQGSHSGVTTGRVLPSACSPTLAPRAPPWRDTGDCIIRGCRCGCESWLQLYWWLGTRHQRRASAAWKSLY